MIGEFKKFVMRGNVLDMAVGIIIGAAFGGIVGSFVNDIVMPPIGLLLGKVDFANMYLILKQGTEAAPYASLAAAKTAGAVTLNYGNFITLFINFLIVAFAVFMMVKAVNSMKKKEEPASAPEPTTKDCPYCYTAIPLKARRCPHCTSELS